MGRFLPLLAKKAKRDVASKPGFLARWLADVTTLALTATESHSNGRISRKPLTTWKADAKAE